MDARRAGTCPPKRFASENALRKYSKNNHRFFPLDQAKGGLLTALLIEMSKY